MPNTLQIQLHWSWLLLYKLKSQIVLGVSRTVFPCVWVPSLETFSTRKLLKFRQKNMHHEHRQHSLPKNERCYDGVICQQCAAKLATPTGVVLTHWMVLHWTNLVTVLRNKRRELRSHCVLHRNIVFNNFQMCILL